MTHPSDPWAGLTRAVLENVATMAAAVITILGLYALGAGGFSAIGFVFLLNINYFRKTNNTPRDVDE